MDILEIIGIMVITFICVYIVVDRICKCKERCIERRCTCNENCTSVASIGDAYSKTYGKDSEEKKD